MQFLKDVDLTSKPMRLTMLCMAKKNPAVDRVVTSVRFKSEDEREEFKRAAEVEGFSTMSAWMMYHLRNQAKQTLGSLEQSKN